MEYVTTVYQDYRIRNRFGELDKKLKKHTNHHQGNPLEIGKI